MSDTPGLSFDQSAYFEGNLITATAKVTDGLGNFQSVNWMNLTYTYGTGGAPLLTADGSTTISTGHAGFGDKSIADSGVYSKDTTNLITVFQFMAPPVSVPFVTYNFTLTISFNGLSGNFTNTTTGTITITQRAPTLSSLTVNGTNFNISNTGTNLLFEGTTIPLSVGFTAAPSHTVYVSEAYITDSSGTVQSNCMISNSGGSVSGNFTLPSANGTYTEYFLDLQAYTDNSSGNYCYYQYPLYVTVKPTISITAPSTATEGANYNMSASASHPTFAIYSIAMNPGGYTFTNTAGTTSYATSTINGQQAPIATSLSSTFSVTAGTTIQGGNGNITYATASAAQTVGILEAAPTCSAIGGVSASYNEGSTATVSATGSSAHHSVSQIKYSLSTGSNNTGTIISTGTSASGGSWSTSMPIATSASVSTLYFNAQSVDNLGGTSAWSTLSTQVSPIAPTLSYSVSPSTIYEGGTVTVSWTAASSYHSIASVAVTLFGTQKTSTSASGSLSFTAPTGIAASSASYSISVTAKDNLGVGNYQSGYVTVHETLPTITSLSASPSPVTEGSSFTISAAASQSGGDGISSITVAFNGTNYTISGSSGSVSVTAPKISTKSQSYTISAYATTPQSVSGSTSTASITVNAATPAVSITAPASNATINEGSSFTTSWSITDAYATVSSLSLKFNGTTYTPAASATSYTLTAPLVKSNTASSIELDVTMSDGMTASTILPITIAAIVPSLSVTVSPASVTEGGTFTVSATASTTAPSTTISSVTATYNGSTLNITTSAGTFTAQWLTSSSSISGTISVTATDSNGTAATKTASVTISSANPTLSISAPSSISEGASFNVTVTAASYDNATISSIQASVSGSSNSIAPNATTVSSTPISLTAPILASGTATNYTITVTATTSYGKSVQQTATLAVQPLAPSLVWSSSNPASANELASFTIAATPTVGASYLTVKNVQFTYNGSTQTITASPWQATFTAAKTAGSNISSAISATVNQSDGSSKNITGTITINQIPPTVSITAIPTSVNELASFTVGVSAATPDGAGIDHIGITYNGTTLTTGSSTGTTAATGTVTFTAQATAGSNATATVTATAYSKDTSTATTSQSLTIVEIPPTITITPVASTVTETGSVQVNISASSVSANTTYPSGIKQVVITYAQSSDTVLTQTITSGGTGSTFTATATFTPYHTKGSNETATITATATAADTATSQDTDTMTITEILPTVSFTTINGSAISGTPQITTQSTFTVGASATDVDSISSIAVTYNGTTNTITGSSGTVTFTAQSTSGANINTSISAVATASDGVTATATQNVTIMQPIPVVNFGTISTQQNASSSSSIYETNTFYVQVSATSPVSTVTQIAVTYNGTTQTITGASGYATFTAQTTKGANVNATISATATAADNSTGTNTTTVQILEILPTVSVTSVPSSVNEQTTFQVSVSASHLSGISQIVAQIGSSTATITGSSGTATLTAPAVPGTTASPTAATITVTATAVDGSQNSTTAAITVNPVYPSIASSSYPSSVQEGSAFTVSITGADSVSTISNIALTFNSTNASISSGGSASFTAPLTSGVNASYNIGITLTSADGRTYSTTLPVTIAEQSITISSCSYKSTARSGSNVNITVTASHISGISSIAITYNGTQYTGTSGSPITIKCQHTNKKIQASFAVTVTATDTSTTQSTYYFYILPGMSFDKLAVSAYLNLEVSQILYGGGTLVQLGRFLRNNGRLVG